ncbi:MAG: ornithine cyclodeaminase family protein [Chloroflexi bacterium]|nr:ornithine cyclodeaminase family protein [Chloroflexota bacterium]
MLILNAGEIRQALPMAECIEAMKRAYAALSAGKAEVPLRLRLPVKPNEGLSIFMPAFVDDEAGQALAVKIVSLFDRNPARGLPFIHAGVLVLNAETGAVEALLEGGSLTAIRTGAGCGAATDVLARKDARTLAIFGAGVQARTQLKAACEVRDVETAWVYDLNSEQVQTFLSEMAARGRIPKDLRAAQTPAEAVENADIISAATTSNTPVFADRDLKPGAHINGVGSYTPGMQEIPDETVARARVTVDSRSAAQAESGDIAIPLQKKSIEETQIAEIGEIILGTQPGRSAPEQITLFKSVGVAVQDAVAARLAVKNARKLGLGTEVEW